MTKAYRYVRFSLANQANGASYERQLEAVQLWKDENQDVELSGESFEDLGLSGHTGKHLENAFGRLLLAIETGKIVKGDYILVEAVDRLGRLPNLDMFDILKKIVDAGVTIVTLDDGNHYNLDNLNRNQGLLASLVGKFEQAYNYSRILSHRVSHSWELRRQKARKGESVKMRTPFWLDKSNEVIPEYSEIIKNVFEWYSLGDGQRVILRKLRERWPEVVGDGFRKDFLLKTAGNKTKMVNAGTVKKWLHNKAAIGYWGDIPGVYEPVVSQELFYKVQAELNSKVKRTSEPKRYFVTGLAKCRCGSNLTFVKNTRKGGKVNINGRCTTRGRVGYGKDKHGNEYGCDNGKTIPAVVLDVIAHQCLPDIVTQLAAANHDKKLSDELHLVEGKLSEISKKIERLSSVLLDSDDAENLPEVGSKIQMLSSERRVLLDNKDALLAKIGNSGRMDDLAFMLEHEGEYRKDYPKFNRLLQKAGYRLVCDGHNITVYIPNGRTYRFEYLGFDRKPANQGGQQYKLKITDHNKVLPIPRDEPITSISGDDFVTVESVIPIEADTLKGKTPQQIASSSALLQEFELNVAEQLVSLATSALKKTE
ncbi:recombinase family protein [Shewanella submarina]|uniref:Recombinase family protein n=1 Tax=Shewanella submarina TaxID=2016376 RepID=A0ABV7GBM6_9GAMM|nr:recombinase family protein [Shewanella submarina]MCL1036719.1 recombinase family protein [Shewanella submarina]